MIIRDDNSDPDGT